MKLKQSFGVFAPLREVLLLICITTLVAGVALAADRPHIVFMLSDDQAWNGLSVPRHPDLDRSKSSVVETPNLEKLAAQGMRFSAAYAPASDCSPTGISLQTGLSVAFSTVNAQQPPRKPRIDDTIKANVYADNSFQLYFNGVLVAVDSIAFVPHNVVSVDVLPAYPMTIAVMGIDNADPLTGMEYANTNIGDGGFILKLGDGTVTNATWKAKKFSWGPIDGDTKNPRVESIPVPANWYTVEFDDSQWPNAKEFTEEEVGPKEPFFEHDFKGAKFIWSDDVKLDNLVLFRCVVKLPPDNKNRPDFRGLNDVVPQGGGRPGGGRENPPR